MTAARRTRNTAEVPAITPDQTVAQPPTPTTNTVPQGDQPFNSSARMAHFNALRNEITVQGIVVPFIPCPRCTSQNSRTYLRPGRLLFRTAGGEIGGDGRCNNCEGKGRLYPADIVRNILRERELRRAGAEEQKKIEDDFNQAYRAAQAKQQQSVQPQASEQPAA